MRVPKLAVLLLLYFTVFALYCIFSYALTDPNLVLNSNPLYWQFQQWMWQHLFGNRTLLSYIYLSLVIISFVIYLLMLQHIRNMAKNWSARKLILAVSIVSLPLLLSYNALSHDVFNYIFNARMVLDYGADPHVNTAIEFSDDLWTRFMHNTHTPAPYGRGWTIISLVPYLLGTGKFILTWFAFRLFALISLIMLFFAVYYYNLQVQGKKINLFWLSVLFLNPLLLIETLSNMHNDLWMVSISMLGLAFIWKAVNSSKYTWLYFAVGIILWLLSVYIKLVTVVLLPIICILIFTKIARSRVKKYEPVFSGIIESQIAKINVYLPDLAALLLFLPLLTSRSQQFHPWYLLWILPWLPFMHHKLLKYAVVILSLTSLLRYTPWLLAGGFTDGVLLNQKIITWSLPLLFLAVILSSYRRRLS